MRYLITLLTLSFAAVTSWAAETKTDCYKEEKPVPYQYCITYTEGSKHEEVLYYLHPITFGPKAWSEDKQIQSIADEWKKLKKELPTVVTVSFGPIWVLAPKQADLPNSGLLEVFVKDVQPTIEKDKLNTKNPKRLLLGKSMGGLNAFQLYTENQKDYAKAALICPAISSVSPFITDEELNTFAKNTKGANKFLVIQARGLAKKYFTEASWKSDSPLARAEKVLAKDSPPLYLSGDTLDQWGFYPGALELKKIAEGKKLDFKWVNLEGAHCVPGDSAEVAKFLAE